MPRTLKSRRTGSTVSLGSSNVLRQDYADKPITSRAHLVDIPPFLEKHGLPAINTLIADKISLETIKAVVAEHRLDIRPGDILLLHTGFFEALFELNSEEQEALGKRSKEEKGWCGVEATEDMLRWHWDQGIAAVATDTWVQSLMRTPTDLAAWHTSRSRSTLGHHYIRLSSEDGDYPSESCLIHANLHKSVGG